MKARLSVMISADLRREIDEHCERNSDNGKNTCYRRHTLSREVEELLRTALRMHASGHYMLLEFDPGLWSWIKSYSENVGMLGNMVDSVMHWIRFGLIEETKAEHIQNACLPGLLPSIQRAFGYRP